MSLHSVLLNVTEASVDASVVGFVIVVLGVNEASDKVYFMGINGDGKDTILIKSLSADLFLSSVVACKYSVAFSEMSHSKTNSLFPNNGKLGETDSSTCIDKMPEIEKSTIF